MNQTVIHGRGLYLDLMTGYLGRPSIVAQISLLQVDTKL